MIISEQQYSWLQSKGVTFNHGPGMSIPDAVKFEPPCAIKWLTLDHSVDFGAFSYGVSGFIFAAKIGRYVSIGENVSIGRHNHRLSFASTSPYFTTDYRDVLHHDFSPVEEVNFRDFIDGAPEGSFDVFQTTIGNDVWIGHGAFISPGVTIGTGAVIGAHSVVTKDIPPYAIAAGAPAVIKRYRFDSPELIQRLLDSQWWHYAFWQLNGIRIHDLDAFLGRVEAMKSDGIPSYAPHIIKSGDLIKISEA